MRAASSPAVLLFPVFLPLQRLSLVPGEHLIGVVRCRSFVPFEAIGIAALPIVPDLGLKVTISSLREKCTLCFSEHQVIPFRFRESSAVAVTLFTLNVPLQSTVKLVLPIKVFLSNAERFTLSLKSANSTRSPSLLPQRYHVFQNSRSSPTIFHILHLITFFRILTR